MRCLFLYNPNSGKGKISRKLDRIVNRLRLRYDEVTVCATKSGKDMEERARKGADFYDVIVFSGGDGTFHNVLQGIGDRDVQLGYIPSGTVNDVARSLGIPRGLKGALDVIVNGNAERLDCMRVNGVSYAMYIAAAGAFTGVTYGTPQEKKRKFGKAAYAVEGLKNEFDFQSFPVCAQCGGKIIKTQGVLIFIMNGRTVAGFPVNRQASMRDGVLETAVIKQAGRVGFFGKISACLSIAHLFLFGYKIKKRDIECLRGERVLIETREDVLWDFDGEKGCRGNVVIEVLPRRVKLFVPKNKKI